MSLVKVLLKHVLYYVFNEIIFTIFLLLIYEFFYF